MIIRRFSLLVSRLFSCSKVRKLLEEVMFMIWRFRLAKANRKWSRSVVVEPAGVGPSLEATQASSDCFLLQSGFFQSEWPEWKKKTIRHFWSHFESFTRVSFHNKLISTRT